MAQLTITNINENPKATVVFVFGEKGVEGTTWGVTEEQGLKMVQEVLNTNLPTETSTETKMSKPTPKTLVVQGTSEFGENIKAVLKPTESLLIIDDEVVEKVKRSQTDENDYEKAILWLLVKYAYDHESRDIIHELVKQVEERTE